MNAVTRAYYDEGELASGSPSQPYFYGSDQIGSVRRAFASTSSAPAYGYDPYGNALQGAALSTDFGYSGMLYNSESSLYLTKYRPYDPAAGRWLSRDPVGEGADESANLYRYVDGNPVSFIDPSGRWKDGPPKPPDPAFDDCDVQLENDMARCRGMRCSRQEMTKCTAQAMQRYSACLSGRRGKELPPPYMPFTMKDMLLVVGGIVIIGGIFFVPEMTLPLLLVAP